MRALLYVGLLVFVAACSPEPAEPEAAADPQPAAEAPTRNAPTTDGRTRDAQEPSADSRDAAPTILFLGNSLSAGYGLDESQAFPALIQQKIDSLGWNFRVVNAGLSGETTAGGRRRVGWLLRNPVDVLVLELGGNDALRGVDPEAAQRNLQAIIDTTRARYPDARIVLAGMEAPPNMGTAYTSSFRQIYPELAEANDAALIPFLLEDVGGIPELNLPDGIHPTAQGHRIVAKNVWETLRPVLASLREEQQTASLQ